MNDTSKSTATDRPANWPAHALEQIRLVRILKTEYAACDELLSITLGLLRASNLERDRARANTAARAEANRLLHAEIARLLAELRLLRRQTPPPPPPPQPDWHQANVAEAAEAESMQAFFAAWPLGTSNPATKYPEGRP